MKKIKANDLIVMYKVNGRWKAIAFATSCEIDISADTIETSSPYTGSWKTFKKRKKGWKISTAHLMGNVKNKPDFFELLESNDLIQVCFTTVEAHKEIIDYTGYKQSGHYQLTGSALVVRLTETARKGDMVTLSAELLGSGKIEQVWAKWVFVDGLWYDRGVWMDDGIWGEDL